MKQHITMDRAGSITVEAIDLSDGTDLQQHMRDLLHDCPECRAAMAAGEQPIMMSGADLLAMYGGGGRAPRARFGERAKPVRWRTRKQRR